MKLLVMSWYKKEYGALKLFLQLGHVHVKREPSITLTFSSGSKSTLTESHTVYDPSVLQAGHVIFMFLNDDINYLFSI